MKKNKNIVVIGGGTGSFVVLSGLKNYDCNLSAIVTMADEGGSTGKLRDEMGVLPPGDVRQCLVALSDADTTLRKLFLYRFNEGSLKGHNFGNIFLAALEKITGDFKKGLLEAQKVLSIKGKVIPVTTQKTRLFAKLEDGQIIKGEDNIDVPKHDGRLKIINAYLIPKAKANKDAIDAIKKADIIVLGPGDLYTSLVPNLLVRGINNAIKKSKAKKVFVCSLMTKFGQTNGFKSKDFVNIVEEYLGKNVLDYVLVNTKNPSRKLLEAYKKEKEFLVEDSLNENKYKIIRADLLKSGTVKKTKSDVIRRSLIRHDPKKLAKAILAV